MDININDLPPHLEFEIRKHSQEIDSINDIDKLKLLLKNYVRLYICQKYTFEVVLKEKL